jgi:hypothetical protein
MPASRIEMPPKLRMVWFCSRELTKLSTTQWRGPFSFTNFAPVSFFTLSTVILDQRSSGQVFRPIVL